MRSTFFTRLVRTSALVLGASVVMVACSGGSSGNGDGGDGPDNGPDGGGNTSQVGFANLDEQSSQGGAQFQRAQTETSVTGGGGFMEFSTTLPSDFVEDPFAAEVDTCSVFSLDDEEPFGGEIPLPDISFEFLDAGDPLQVKAGGQAYATLNRRTPEGTTVIAYDLGGEEPATPLPSGLTLTIPPGADFPAFTDAAFPDVDPFTLTAPADPGASGAVDVDTTFSWSTAGGSADTVVVIDVFSATSLTSVTSVSCIAQDDGSFEFPADTRSELGSGFSGSVTSAGRQGLSVHTQGDAALFLSTTRSETYGLSFGPTGR